MTKAPASYLSKLITTGFSLLILFAGTFYLLALFRAKGALTTRACLYVISSVWIASIIIFVRIMCGEFRELYRFSLQRMRLYRRVFWFTGFYLVWTVICVPTVVYVLLNYKSVIVGALESYHLRAALASFATSLFYSFVIAIGCCNFVASRRGNKVWKH
jgi:hypothetical protein